MTRVDYITYKWSFNKRIEVAEAELLKRFNLTDIKDAYIINDKTNLEMKNAIDTYCETYAELLLKAQGLDCPEWYSLASESQIENWTKGKFLLNENEKLTGSTLESFQDENFQDNLFNSFFTNNPEGNHEQTPSYIPNTNSGFAVNKTPTIPSSGIDFARKWLKNGGFRGNSPIDSANDNFNKAKETEPIKVDPLLVDLDGDGIETTDTSNGIIFDHANDGFAESSAWVGKDDGMLVIDKNNDGIINNGTELLGDSYIKTDGTQATSGFDALSDFDSNEDGIINKQDKNFSQLKVYKGDGTLLTLEEAGIVAINLTSTETNIKDENENIQHSTGTFVKSDGSEGIIGDYLLDNNKMNSIASEWLEETDEVAQLPDINGQGTVYSLHQAILRDESGELKQLIENFIAETNIGVKRTLVKEIIYKWTGANLIASDSRGENIDAKNLYVLEKFMGEDYIGIDGTGNPNNQACNLLDNAFAIIRDYIYAELQAQTSLKPLYSLLDFSYNSNTAKYEYNLNAVISYIDNAIEVNATDGKALLTDFVQTFLSLKLNNESNYTDFYNHYSSMSDEYKYLMETVDKVVIYGDSNDNNIEGTAQNEAVFGEGGNDTIYTRQGIDLVYGGDGDDYIDTCEDDDTIFGDSGNDEIHAGSGNDKIYAGDGNDIIHTGDGDDTVFAGNGNDTIYAESGNNIIDAGDGDDNITSYYGNDKLIGGKGNDIFSDLSNGDDTFIFNKGDGNDIITNRDGNDTIQFGEGFLPQNIRFHGVNNDLIISFTDSDESITVKNCINDNRYIIENLVFADGTTITADQYMLQLINQGSINDDIIQASYGNDTIYGNGGNDTIYAESGDDTIYTLDGDDNIEADNGNDTIYAGDGNDIIQTGNGDDTVFAGNGNDTIYAESGNNIVDAGDGDDNITSYNGNDKLIGGKGNDIFSDLSNGDDTFIFNKGDGNDIITNRDGNDTIQFGESVDINNIAFFLDSSNNLFIDYGDKAGNDTIKINNQGDSKYTIEKIEIKNSAGDIQLLTNEDINQIIQDISTYATDNGIILSSVTDIKDNPDLMNIIANSIAT